LFFRSNIVSRFFFLFFISLCYSFSAVDCGFDPWSDQTKDYEIGICCFSAKHAALRSKSHMSTYWMLFQWASKIKNSTKRVGLVHKGDIMFSSSNGTHSRHDMAEKLFTWCSITITHSPRHWYNICITCNRKGFWLVCSERGVYGI
jgi:hypothetical protein